SEAARQLAETGRVNAEQMRVQAENGRVTAEGLRDQAETARETAEGLRGQAETARETAEGLRDQAETDRQTAEEEREDGYATIEQNAQAALSYIAPSESTTTASAAHAAGDHLIYNGVYYEVIADIAVGDTLATSGTGANIKAVPDGVSGEVEELKSALNESKNLFTQFTTFARGSQSSGNINNYSNRVRSDIMTFNYPIYVTPNDGFRVNYSYFEDGAYINGTALKATTQYIPAGLSFRISIARVTEISDEQADIEYFSRQATFDTCLRYDIDTNAELIILE
ncbi:MAG: hypothetical protein IJ157_04845, partial [Clostridia bacterium]|nr:hypothetical protein [Clostridia bacterium]